MSAGPNSLQLQQDESDGALSSVSRCVMFCCVYACLFVLKLSLIGGTIPWEHDDEISAPFYDIFYK